MNDRFTGHKDVDYFNILKVHAEFWERCYRIPLIKKSKVLLNCFCFLQRFKLEENHTPTFLAIEIGATSMTLRLKRSLIFSHRELLFCAKSANAVFVVWFQWPILYYSRIIRLDELWQTFCSPLYMRLRYKDGHKAHYASRQTTFRNASFKTYYEVIVCPDA